MADTNNDHLVQSQDPDHPANLIPRLCRQFYTLGELDNGFDKQLRVKQLIFI